MSKAVVALLICIAVAWVARRVWIAVLQLRSGAIPDDVDVHEIPMERDRGWQLTRAVEKGVATIRVEHPDEGLAREWTVHLRDPGARSELEDAMRRAARLVQNLASGG